MNKDINNYYMDYLKFDKQQMVNLEYSLDKEILRSNRAGSFASTTIIGCNTRKYHGLLICPLKQFENERHILLSSVDETVIQRNTEFHLGIHKYKGDVYLPKGHKYVVDYETEKVPKITFRVGGVILTKERVLVEKEEQLLIKYTLIDAHSPVKIRLQPLLAFRNIHSLTRANMSANTKVHTIDKGISSKLYPGFPSLHMQLSHQNEFIHIPDWYYNVEYIREMERGYDYKEDLFSPGYFEFNIKKGESIIFSASTSEANSSGLKRKFSLESDKRNPKDSYKNCLINSAQQFIQNTDKKTEVIAGFPWYGVQTRDTLISLPGLTLATDNLEICKSVLDTLVKQLKGGVFQDYPNDPNNESISSDTPLWFIWSIQKYSAIIKNPKEIWSNYGKSIRSILKMYYSGTNSLMYMDKDGLIYSGSQGYAVTWMNCIHNGKPVTPRIGKVVEINALWYNAICFALELATASNDNSFIKQWKNLPKLIENSFLSTFWSQEKGYLADFVNDESKNWQVRPNMVIATAMDYRLLPDLLSKSILEKIKKELLTRRGLRSLSPNDPEYQGIYEGYAEMRELIYHQGTVWPWLMQFYARGSANILGAGAIVLLKKILDDFEPVMHEHGIGSVSEIYDGDPPHYPRGAVSQAISVSALLQIFSIIEELELK